MMGLAFEPIDAPIGAIVRGFDPSAPLTGDLIAALDHALVDHAVLVFRGQAIEPAELVALGRAFGALEILPEPDKLHPDHPQIFNLTNVGPDGNLVEFDDPQAVFLRGTERWHTDSSFREIPALCTMLYALEVPTRGGQTQFADMRTAHDVLPADLRAEMAQLRLVHSYEYSRAHNPGRLEPMTAAERSKYPPVEHPWVRTNGDGRRSLYMGGHVSHIVGRPQDEGRAWIEEILATVAVHDIVYEHRWQTNDLVVWDNRTTLHRLLPYDIANERRVMQRITVAGTEPVVAADPQL